MQQVMVKSTAWCSPSPVHWVTVRYEVCPLPLSPDCPQCKSFRFFLFRKMSRIILILVFFFIGSSFSCLSSSSSSRNTPIPVDGNLYPDTLTVSSTGGAADEQPESLGLYRKTTLIWSGRPVWQSTVSDDRYLFFNGSNLMHVLHI